MSSCSNRLAPYQDLLVGEPATETSPPRGREVQVTYLGVNGYLIRSATTTLMVDPYFTRIPLRSTALNAPVSPDYNAINLALTSAATPRRIDGYLVTHAHFDHLFDVPSIQKRYGGRILTSPTGSHLCRAMGVRHGNISAKLPGSTSRIGDAKIHVIPARHDKVLGRIPYPGLIDAPLDSPPVRPRDWRLGTPLAYVIELEGKRIYVESGGMGEHVPKTGSVDLAIIGVAVAGSQKRYPDAVRALSPKWVLPSHQDDFFVPVGEGFQFSALSNFPRIKATHEGADLPGKLILMDYFTTWSLPAH